MNGRKGPVETMRIRAALGRSEDVDHLMSGLDEKAGFAWIKIIDYALSLVESVEGMDRIAYYLYEGNPIQRNYAALFFKRRRREDILEAAVNHGCIDHEQAFSR